MNERKVSGSCVADPLDPELVLLISRWRARAVELLAQAEKIRDADARLTMHEVAAKYEILAQRVEQQIRLTEQA